MLDRIQSATPIQSIALQDFTAEISGLDALARGRLLLFDVRGQRNSRERLWPPQVCREAIAQGRFNGAARAAPRQLVHGTDQAGQPLSTPSHLSTADSSHEKRPRPRSPQRDLDRTVPSKIAGLVAILQQKRFKRGSARCPRDSRCRERASQALTNFGLGLWEENGDNRLHTPWPSVRRSA